MESLKLHKTRLNSFIVVSHYILFVKMLQLTYLAMIFIWHALLICVWCAWYKELKWKELSVWIYFALCRRKWTEHKTKCQDGWTHVAERVAKFFNGIHSVCYFCVVHVFFVFRWIVTSRMLRYCPIMLQRRTESWRCWKVILCNCSAARVRRIGSVGKRTTSP